MIISWNARTVQNSRIVSNHMKSAQRNRGFTKRWTRKNGVSWGNARERNWTYVTTTKEFNKRITPIIKMVVTIHFSRRHLQSPAWPLRLHFPMTTRCFMIEVNGDSLARPPRPTLLENREPTTIVDCTSVFIGLSEWPKKTAGKCFIHSMSHACRSPSSRNFRGWRSPQANAYYSLSDEPKT